jgi:hypothetical protein
MSGNCPSCWLRVPGKEEDIGEHSIRVSVVHNGARYRMTEEK